MSGFVYLTGAGPGDWQLITLKAAEALKKADTVVYDRLADERILRFAPSDAEYIYVGKSAGNHTLKQSEISQLLVDKAKEGKCVVRLKGGDPFVFGRGGEEALLLRENNISFEIIPGVTSAIAVPAYAGIPVTHRAVAASFAVITGHETPDKVGSDVRWEKLATAADTLVFLMGVANLPEIAAKLIENGRSADTPVALISQGTKLQQRTVVTTLKNAAEDSKRAGIKPPAVIIAGEVVKLRENLNWFENVAKKPIFGKTVLVTRARRQASALTEKLEALGANVIEIPLIELKPPMDNYSAMDKAINRIDEWDWLIFTSVNGVEHFFARLFDCGKDVRTIKARIAAIGTATAERLKKYGIIADAVPKKYQAEGILEALSEKIGKGTKILLPRAEKARNVLPEGLRKMGAEVEVVSAYRTIPAAVADETAKMLINRNIDYVTFASSSTVESFVSTFGEEALTKAKIACIGPITADTCKKYTSEPLLVAEEYTIDGLIKVICE